MKNHVESFIALDFGVTLRQSINRLVPVIAFLITAIQFTYWLGQRSRQAIDAANDALASLWAIGLGAGEERHRNALDEVLNLITAIFSPARPVEALPVMAVAAPPAPPIPSNPVPPRKPRPARRRRAPAKKSEA